MNADARCVSKDKDNMKIKTECLAPPKITNLVEMSSKENYLDKIKIINTLRKSSRHSMKRYTTKTKSGQEEKIEVQNHKQMFYCNNNNYS